MQLRLAGLIPVCLTFSTCTHDTSGPSNTGGGNGGGGPTVSTLTSPPGPTRIAVVGSVLYWLDESDTPLNKISLASATATPTPLFHLTPVPEGELADGAYVYWITGADLYRTSLDGTTTTLLDHGTGPAGAVMTMDANDIYWVNSVASNCSPSCRFAIRRVSKAGGAATPIVTTPDGVIGITAIAIAGGFAFWEEEGVGPAASDGSVGSKINKVSLADGTVTMLVNGLENGLILPPSPGYIPASWHPRGGIVADDAFVYFADADFFQSYRVMAVPDTGGAITILLADTTHDANNFVRSMVSEETTLYWVDENAVRSIPKTGGLPADLAGPRTVLPWSLTRVGTNLYWIESTCCAHRDKGTIYTVPTTGGTADTVIPNLDSPGSIASDPAHVYWTEGGAIGGIEGFGSLRVSALDGSNARTLVESGAAGPFAADATAIYFADKWTIKRVPAAGGTPQRLAIGDFYIADVATDGDRVYWVEGGPFSVVRSVPVNGGAITTLGSGPGPAGRIRLDGTYVYWLAHEDEVDRAPKTGGTPVRLVGPVSGLLTDFAVDASNIYLSEWDGGGISKAPITGGTATPLVGLGVDQTRRIAADGGKVYWIDQRNVGSITSDGRTQVPITYGLLSDPFSENDLAFDGRSVYWTEVAGDAIRRATPK